MDGVLPMSMPLGASGAVPVAPPARKNTVLYPPVLDTSYVSSTTAPVYIDFSIPQSAGLIRPGLVLHFTVTNDSIDTVPAPTPARTTGFNLIQRYVISYRGQILEEVDDLPAISWHLMSCAQRNWTQYAQRLSTGAFLSIADAIQIESGQSYQFQVPLFGSALLQDTDKALPMFALGSTLDIRVYLAPASEALRVPNLNNNLVQYTLSNVRLRYQTIEPDPATLDALRAAMSTAGGLTIFSRGMSAVRRPIVAGVLQQQASLAFRQPVHYLMFTHFFAADLAANGYGWRQAKRNNVATMQLQISTRRYPDAPYQCSSAGGRVFADWFQQMMKAMGNLWDGVQNVGTFNQTKYEQTGDEECHYFGMNLSQYAMADSTISNNAFPFQRVTDAASIMLGYEAAPAAATLMVFALEDRRFTFTPEGNIERVMI